MDDVKTVAKNITSTTKVDSIGTVKVVIGTVKAVDTSGVERILQAGDKVFANETIIAGADSSAIIEFIDGSFIDIVHNSNIVLDSGIFTPTVVKEGELTAEQIQEMITRGEDPTAVTAATAAGGTSGDEGSSSYVVVDFNAAQGDVTSGYPTRGIPSEQFPTEPRLPPVEEIPPPSISVGVDVGVGGQPGGEDDVTIIPGDSDIVSVGVDTINIPELTSQVEGQPGTHPVTFFILLNNISTLPVTVTYDIVGAAATKGVDFVDGTYHGTVTIPAGAKGFTVTLFITEDNIPEANEDFKIVLSDPINATLINDTATVTIIDDDVTINPMGNAGDETDGLQTLSGVLNINYGPGDTGSVAASLTGGTWTGAVTVSPNGQTITANDGSWKLVINSDGTYTFTQNAALSHPDASNPDDPLSFQFTVVATDSAGNSSSPASFTITVDDDGPHAAISLTETGSVTVDESAGLQDDDVTGPLAVFSGVAAKSGDMLQFAQSVGAVVINDGSVVGADLAGATKVFSLEVNGSGATGLKTTDGDDITITKEGSLIVGRDEGDNAVFAISIDAGTGVLSVVQYESIYNPIPGASYDETVSLAGFVTAKLTFTDGDGDVSTATVDIGDRVRFSDDGPTADIARTTNTVVMDESLGIDAADPNAASDDNVAANPFNAGWGTPIGLLAGVDLVNITTSTGADQEGATSVVTLSIVGDSGADSGLQTTDGLQINLYLEADGTVTGRVGGEDGAVIFAVSINNAGEVTVAQYDALKHPTPGDSYDESVDLAGKLNAVVTVTDGDGDIATDSVAIGNAIVFEDDGPTAYADSNNANEGQLNVTGNVLTDNDDVFGADGATAGGGVVGVRAAVGDTTTAVTTGVGTQITTAYGTLTLNANGSYDYDAKSNVTIAPGTTDVFVYTIKDGDGDLSTTTLTINLTDSGLVAPDDDEVLVSEKALDTTQGGSDLAASTYTGSIPSDTGETDASNQLNATGGFGALTYALADGESAVGDYGTIQINANGTYTYTLTKPYDTTPDSVTTAAQTEQNKDSFNYKVTDANGNTTTGTIYVDIIDDVPTAVADTNTVTEGGIVGGNVLTDGTDDVFGADGAAAGGGVVGVKAGSDTSTPVITGVGTTITGTYGTLTLGANGAYTYDGAPNVVPPAGATDTFVYTIKDGDGDMSTTTLTITLTDSALAATNDDISVNEAALSTGSNPSSTAETAAGTLVGNVTGGTPGYTYALTSSATGSYGTLTLNPNGTYSYTLTQRYDTSPDANNGTNTENNRDTFTYQATDANGNTVTNTITIDIIDDVPTVVNKSDLIYSSSSNDGPGPLLGGTGVFEYKIGADRHTSYTSSNSDFSAITLTGTVGGVNISGTPTVSWASETDSTAVFNISFSYAPNSLDPTVTTSATGTLTFDKVAGTYTVELAAPIQSVTTLQTSGGLSFTGYHLDTSTPDATQPDIMTTKLSDNFYVQFTGDHTVGGNTPVPLSAGGNNAFVAGETFAAADTWVSVSGSANGVAGDTLQRGEVLDFNFYSNNPTGMTTGNTVATASSMFLRLDGFGGEDFVVVLKLADPNNLSITTTVAITVQGSDVYTNADTLPTGYTNLVPLDSNDGLVIIDPNDYLAAAHTVDGVTNTVNWVITGAQVVTSVEGISGSGVDLQKAPGIAGASGDDTTVFTAADTDSDVVKVSDIGITTSNTSTADANLKFNVSVVDADGDITATQTLNVTIEGSHTFVGLDGVVESITGTSSGNDILTGGTGSDIFHWNTGDTGQDTITDFSKGPVGSGGDVLNLTDLLQGEHQTVASLADGGYLSFSYSGGNTTITIDANGTTGVGGSGQTIVLQGVDLTAGNTLSAQDIVTNLLNDHQLKTDA